MVSLTKQFLKTHIYTSFPRGAGVTVHGLANDWPLGFRAVLDLSWCVERTGSHWEQSVIS